MTNQEMTERYIYAVTRQLPGDSRDDVAKELAGLIGDMLEERTGGSEPTQEQLREVLGELGNPYNLAASYHPQPGGLIPQPYYTHYLTVLRIVLAAACGGVAIALLVSAVFEPSLTFAQIVMGQAPDSYIDIVKFIGSLVGAMFNAGVQGFAWVTIIFAAMARKGVDLGKNFKLEDLPELPANRKPIGKGGAIADIVLSTIFSMILLLAPGVFCVISDGMYAPVFEPSSMQGLWWVFVGIGVSGIVSGCAELMEGYHTVRLMAINIVCNVAFAVLAVVWLGNPAILSSGYHSLIAKITSETGLAFMSNLNFVVLGGILLGTTVDTVSSVWQTLRK